MRTPKVFSGISARFYFTFLATAVVPVAVAGLIGIHYSIQALRKEALSHLGQEVASRSETVARFMEQLASEVLYLSASPSLDLLVESASEEAPQQMERDFAVFATAYPYIYQVRYLDAEGHEIVRVDRRDDGVQVAPKASLQNKSDRYYFRDAMTLDPGQIYVSPLDLNVEHGQVELPERPVVRVATPVASSSGAKRGLLIINLHAELFLKQVQQMAEVHGGTAYLFDRAGFFLAQTSQAASPLVSGGFRMDGVETLGKAFPRSILPEILGGQQGVRVSEGQVLAFSPVGINALAGHRGTPPRSWVLALAYPQSRFLHAVSNLYLLYALLVAALAATAAVGWLMSRHFLHRLVDERREQDRQMFQREKMTTLGELAMGLAHEIGNPLAGMKAVVQVLRQEEQPSPAMAKYLPRLENEIERLSGFLRTFHGFAAPQEHHPQACRLEDVLDDVLLWTRKEAREKDIVIQHRHCSRDIPPLLADPNQLKQLLLNLVINAIHATERPGTITLSMCNAPLAEVPARHARKRVHFCVEDTGSGIPPELRTRIFEPFFTTRPDGTGLGLAVVKKIADQHGATIRIHQQRPHGTRIEFDWPAAVEEETEVEAVSCPGSSEKANA
jgi:signal transduction histidine kinase